MKINLSLKQLLAIFLTTMVLAMLMLAPLGMKLAARMARGATEPRVVAVNWNSSSPDSTLNLSP